MHKIWYRNPSKFIGRCGGDDKTSDHAETTKVEQTPIEFLATNLNTAGTNLRHC